MTVKELQETGEFENMSTGADETEHSLEMHLPYIYKILSQKFKSAAEYPPLIPILVGNTDPSVERDYGKTVAEISTDEFVRVMVTNALSPLRVIEGLAHRVEPDGMIGVMSSGQGSVTNNERGGHEVYRASKAALNTLVRSYAARHRDDHHTLVLMAPGWVKTDLGGPDARLTIDDSIPRVVTTLEALRGRTGLYYVDYLGQTVPW